MLAFQLYNIYLKIDYIQVGVLKSVLGGSSKIYAGLYDGTPVQIYPNESGNASLIKVLESNYSISFNPGEIKGYNSKAGIQFDISSFTPGMYYIRFIPTSISGTLIGNSSSALTVTVDVGFTGSSSYASTSSLVVYSIDKYLEKSGTYNMTDVNLLDEREIKTASVIYNISGAYDCRTLSYNSGNYHYDIKISSPIIQYISVTGTGSTYYTASINIAGKLIFYKLQF